MHFSDTPDLDTLCHVESHLMYRFCPRATYVRSLISVVLPPRVQETTGVMHSSRVSPTRRTWWELGVIIIYLITYGPSARWHCVSNTRYPILSAVGDAQGSRLELRTVAGTRKIFHFHFFVIPTKTPSPKRAQYVQSLKGWGRLLVEACETIDGAGGPKVVDLSANVLPFSVTRVAYLISASWLPRIGLATRDGGFRATRKSERIQAIRKNGSERKKFQNGRVRRYHEG